MFSLWYKHSISFELKNGARHLKEHPKIRKFTKFDGYWFKPKGMVRLVWIGGTGVLQSILSSLILKVYHAFAFEPITIEFGEFTNFWMLFQMTCAIFNSIDIECSHQEKICSYPVPCSFRTWPIGLRSPHQARNEAGYCLSTITPDDYRSRTIPLGLLTAFFQYIESKAHAH